ncbi:MAG: hypothetical protein GXP14_14325 [Gammaproteobacteria bacterium]|nr:hypothetical protein [Gammaproteobacteria bacterium]
MKRDPHFFLDEILRRERLRKIKFLGGFILLAVLSGGMVGYSQFRHVETTAIESVLSGILETEQITTDAAGKEKKMFSVRLNNGNVIEVVPSAAMFFKKGLTVNISKQEFGPGRVQYGFVQ